MHRLTLSSLLLALAVAAVRPVLAVDMAGTWMLEVRDLNDQPKVSAQVRFSETAAFSCMAGTWRALVVEAVSTRSDEFFPIGAPLAYSTYEGTLTIGRTEVCDGYLFLSGAENAEEVRGIYSFVSIRGGKPLGTFALRRQ